MSAPVQDSGLVPEFFLFLDKFDWLEHFFHRTGTEGKLEDTIGMFPEADLIIVEGCKYSSLPKIEVIRRGISDHAVSNPEGRFLIATDWPEDRFDEPQVSINDVEAIVKEIRRICL